MGITSVVAVIYARPAGDWCRDAHLDTGGASSMDRCRAHIKFVVRLAAEANLVGDLYRKIVED